MQERVCRENSLGLPYSYRNQIERELIASLPKRILSTAQAGKVVRTAAGILQMNLLECALLGWLLRKCKYGLVDLSSSSSGIAVFEEDHNKQLLLLILLNAYYVKTYLSQHSPPQVDAEILSLIPDFPRIYRNWRPDNELRNDVLLQLGSTFNSWTLPQRKNRLDYNHLVNKILELSKTYNVTGNQEEPPKKKRKQNEPSVIDEPIEPESGGMMLRSRMVRSWRPSEPSQQNQDIFEYQDRNADLLKRSTRNLNTSGFMRFSELRETRHIFGSRNNINNSILDSCLPPLQEERNSIAPKIRATSSFDLL